MSSRSNVASLSLQPSEASVFEAASRMYAALLGAGRVNDTNAQGIMRYCLRSALQLAVEAEKMIQSEEEIVGQGDRNAEPPELDILEVDDDVSSPPPPQAPPVRRPPPTGGGRVA